MSVTVKEYIINNLERGVSWEKIRSALLNVGHKEEAIDTIYKHIMTSKRYKKASMVLFVILILMAGFLIYSYIHNQVNDNNNDSISTNTITSDNKTVMGEDNLIEEVDMSKLDDIGKYEQAYKTKDKKYCDNIMLPRIREDCYEILSGVN